MKIIYINCSRIPTEKAHGLQMMKMCQAFAKIRDTEVELWVPRRLNSIKQDPFEYYGVGRNFKVRKIPCLDFIPLDKFLGPLAFWLTELSFLSFVTCNLPFVRSDIFYTRDKFVLFFLSFFKRNVFFEAHVIPSGLFFSAMKRARGTVVITRHLKNILGKHGVAENNMIVSPDGVDLIAFDIKVGKEECRKKFGLPQDKKIVLYTGHLYPWKGISVLLEAARKFSLFTRSGEDRQTLFVLVGGTEKDVQKYKLQVASYLKYLPKGDELQNIKIVGHRPHQEIPYWLKAADVLVLPNSGKYDISRYWTSPLKLFEYMASERPIVASDLPSLREVLDEKNAILVSPDDAGALAKGISLALLNKEAVNRLALNAKKCVWSYCWTERAKNILTFILST